VPVRASADADPPPAVAAGTPGDEWDDADSILSWKLLIAIAVVLAFVGVGAMVVVNGRKSDPATVTGSGTDKGGTGGAGSQDAPAARDSFERPDSSSGLGKSVTGEDWEMVAGTWGISGNQAYVSALNDKGPRNIAVVDLGAGDGSVQAKAAKLTDGWGLVFRYRGPNAFWAITAVLPTKTFNVWKFENGKAENVGNIGLVKYDEGATVKVEFVGPSITVFVNGTAIRTITDSYLQSQGQGAGLYGDGKKVVDARWSEFVARKGLTAPSVTVASKGPTTTKPKAGAEGGTTSVNPSPPPAGGGSSTTSAAP